jgi:uncharacterized protein (TIGR03437 family)
MSKTKVIIAWAVLGFASVASYAHSTGPDPRSTTAPGDNSPLACSQSGCHTGTPLNGGGGNVSISMPASYTPGQTYTFQIVVTDSAAHAFGFQMTARLESNPTNGQAGLFTPTPQQFVICDDSTLASSTGCPSSEPVEFIEHNLPYTTNTISVQWTAPAANVGKVHFYVAANAASGDLPSQPLGDHIYSADYVLPPAVACTDSTPAITTVQSAGSFNANAGLASGTWLEIYGSNLTCQPAYTWAGSDFNGVIAPTSLQNVTVTVNGVKAFVYYVSSTQVDVQAPDDPSTGAGIQVVLSNSSGSSNGISMQKNATAPALLAPSSFLIGGKQYVVAQHANGSYVGRAGLISGLNFSPAVPNEVITVYGIGFGPVNPAVAAGAITPGANSIAKAVHFLFGQTAADLPYFGLAPGYVGLYQFNIKVPSAGSGDVALNVDVSGVSIGQSLFITMQ